MILPSNDSRWAVILISEKGSDLEWLSDVLSRATCGRVVKMDCETELSGLLPCEIIAFNYVEKKKNNLAHVLEKISKTEDLSILVFLSGDVEQLAELLSTRSLENIVATKRRDLVENDIAITVQKILQGNIFGIEKYFTQGVELLEFSLSSSSEKRGALEEIQRYAEGHGVPKRFCALFRGVADEFISNALYNGPVDSAGNSRFSFINRKQLVALDSNEEIQISCGCDGRRLGISTVDPFGSLTPPVVLDTMARCFEERGRIRMEKTGGAGIGLYRCLDAVSHLVINISTGRKTECIGLIDVHGSYRHFVEGGKSFNIFVEKS